MTGPHFPHRNYELTRAQAHRLQQEGEDEIRSRGRTPGMSAHNTQAGGQTMYHDRPDRPDDGIGGAELDGWGRFADDY